MAATNRHERTCRIAPTLSAGPPPDPAPLFSDRVSECSRAGRAAAARGAASPIASTTSSVCAIPTKIASCAPGAIATPSSSMAWKKRGERSNVGPPRRLEVDRRRDVTAHDADERADDRELGRKPAAPQASRSKAARWRARPIRRSRRDRALEGREPRLPWRWFPASVPAWKQDQWGQRLHDLPSATDGADRQAATDHLSERRQVGRDVVLVLRATGVGGTR